MSISMTTTWDRSDREDYAAQRSIPVGRAVRRPGPGVLISVREPREAAAAVFGGATVVDVKEPSSGPLGAARPAVWQAVAERLAGARPMSVALGEMADWPERHDPLPAQTRFAKAGPAGIASEERYLRQLRARSRGWAPHVQCVPVAYADYRRAAAPPPWRIAEAAGRQGLGWLLLDTWTKDGRRLGDWLSAAELQRIAHGCARYSLRLVLAGSLRAGDVAGLLRHRPALLAVRGAACRGGRTGAVDAARVRAFAQAVARGERCERFVGGAPGAGA